MSDPDRMLLVQHINMLTTHDINTLNIKKLHGHKDCYRLKVNNFRIIYKIDHNGKLFIVALIGPRKDIYQLVQRLF